MLRLLLFIPLILFANFVFNQSETMDCPNQLIIFTQDSDSLFQRNALAQIKEYCDEKCIDLIEKNIFEGTPEEIVSTPAIVFQNYRGRSIYSSRYMEFATIKNFIRTSRVVPQTKEKVCINQALVWQNGRTKIIGSLKITGLTGKMPKEFSNNDFSKKAIEAIECGMNNFELKNEVCLSKTDRLFYIGAV